MTFLEQNADRLVFVLYAALIFIPLEHILPRRKEQKLLRADLGMDIAYMLLGGLGTKLAATVFITLIVILLGAQVPEAAKSFTGAQPIWLQVIALIVIGDLYYYWAHRLFHTVPALWKFHAVHHSIEHMDWIAAHRTHPLDTAITNSGFVIIAILLDFSAAAVLIFTVQFSIHSLLKHSNVGVGWGSLRWIYVTPTFHHWHHANVKEAYDKNFAAQFPAWDILFGTALMTEKNGPPRYGVDDPVPPTFLGSLLYPFRPHQAAAPECPNTGEAALERSVSD